MRVRRPRWGRGTRPAAEERLTDQGSVRFGHGDQHRLVLLWSADPVRRGFDPIPAHARFELPSVIVQISDPHLRGAAHPNGDADALGATLRRIRRLPQAPGAVLVSGDVTHASSSEQY